MQREDFDNPVWFEVLEQYIEMRGMHGHSVESDVEHNVNGELVRGATVIVDPDESGWPIGEKLEWLKMKQPAWNQQWLERTFHKTYKDRLKVGISLLIAELERVMYLENQRIKANDSSTTINTGNPESDRPGERAGAE